jgi:hypothetical protein
MQAPLGPVVCRTWAPQINESATIRYCTMPVTLHNAAHIMPVNRAIFVSYVFLTY